VERVRKIHEHRVTWGYLLEGLRKSTKKSIRKVDAKAVFRNGYFHNLLGTLISIILKNSVPVSEKRKDEFVSVV